MRVKLGGRILIAVLIVGGLATLGKLWQGGAFDKFIPRETSKSVAKGDLKDFQEKTGMDRPIRVNVVSWYGYAGLYYMNGGLSPSTDSRFYKDYGILVEICLNNDIPTQMNQWKSGEVDVMWGTADALPIDASGIKDKEPKILFQADWSRGGDAIVVQRGITKVSDLRGKRVSVAFGTPSHTLLYWFLNSSGMDWADIEVVKVSSAIEAAEMFKAGQVEAAVVWAPDDQICIQKVPGSSVLQSTKVASNIIADLFYAQKSFIQKNEKSVQSFTEGWLKGNGLINSNQSARSEAAQIMAKTMNVSVGDATDGLNTVRLATLGDNLNFFGLGQGYKGTTGEDLYTKMARVYSSMNLADNPPSWSSLLYTSFIQSANLVSDGDRAEGVVAFKPVTNEEKTVTAFSSKSLSINFPSGSSALTDESKMVVDRFADVTKTFAAAKIRVVGNTDNTGAYNSNKLLSLKRAQSVASYLIQQYGFDGNRFVVIGNGPDAPKGDNATEIGRLENRRTDFELINAF